MSRYLITGGAGFIGSHLAQKLLEGGDIVAILDNFNDYYDPKVKRKNISNCAGHKNASLIEGDIRDAKLVDKIFREFSPEMVIHLAAMAGVRPSIQNPVLYQDVNMIGTTVLLEATRKNNIKKFVFASSSSVYGDTARVPFSEDDALARPVSPYGATKMGGEILCRAYHSLYGLDIVCLRFFTVYGPRQRPDMAIHKFTRAIDEGMSIEVYDAENTSRDYTYIDDIISGLTGSMDFVSSATGPVFEVVNLGESRTVNLGYLVSVIEDAVGKKAKIVHKERQPGDVITTYASVDKARRLFGYNPTTAIEEGVRRFVSWYKGNG